MSKRKRQSENDNVTSSPGNKRRMNDDGSSSKYAHDDYTVGWICALPKEQTAATAMLDHRHADLPKPPKDPNTYTLGAIGEHNIVIACLPKGKYGTISAATVATQMVSTFPSIKFGLMVGIGGGIPPKVRLGDVVVSTPEGSYPGVVQWDMGKALEGGSFQRTGALDNPPTLLLTAISKLESAHELNGSRIPMYLDEMIQGYPSLAAKYLRTDSLKDVLFKAGYGHVSKVVSDGEAALDEADSGEEEIDDDEEEGCRFCDKGKVVKRKPRDMRIHYGLIASGNQVIKDSVFRDKLNKELGGRVLCVEMEAAGLRDNFPCLVIRGICDYADSHKNKDWQEHAAAVAAAFAKELLSHVQPSEVNQQRTVKDLLSQVSAIGDDVGHIRSRLDTSENRDIFDWLTPINYGKQQSDYLNGRQLGTGQWLIDSKEFQVWRSTSKQTLFCPGIPGAGKTILTSIVIDHLLSRFHEDTDTGVAYVYCNYQRQDEQKIENLLSNILKQLAKSQPSLPQSIRDLFNRHNKEMTRPSCDEILGALQSVVALYSRVFIIVDALDECQAAEGCRTRFLSELLMLQKTHGINIFATSRPILEISDVFKSNSVSLEIRATTEDVARYLEGHMSDLPLIVQQDRQLQEKIITTVSEAVDGMFLLARIYLSLLGDKLTLNALRDTIELFGKRRQEPNGDKSRLLDSAYEQALMRIKGQMEGSKNLAINVLSWVTCAKRQLTTLELQHALATKPKRQYLDEGDVHQIRDMVSVCAGLVTVDEKSNVIRLVHYTTQEYLLKTQKQWFPDPDSVIMMTSITYLSFNIFGSGWCQTDQEFEQRLQSNPLYDYAARHWGVHASHDTEPSEEVVNFLQDQVKVEASVQALLAKRLFGVQNYSQQAPRNTMGLHLIGYFGVSKAIDRLLKFGQSVNVKDTYNRTPLWYAAQEGHDAVVERLLAAGAEVDGADKDGRTALQLAARGGHIEIVERLLVAGAVVNAQGGRFGNALQAASRGGYEKVVQMLIKEGADVNAQGGDFGNALHAASSGGHEKVVQMLIKEGADVNAQEGHFGNALQAASSGGHEKVVQMLIKEGAVVNAQGGRFGNALQAASRGGYEKVVQMLIKEGADVNAQEGHFGNALQAASEGGHEKVVQMLIKEGADVNAQGGHFGNALYAASEGGHENVVQMLIKEGADVNTQGGYFGNALQAASLRGHEKVVQMLIKEGAVVNAQGGYFGNALHAASWGGHENVVQILIKEGADVNAQRGNFDNALQAASRGGYEKIVQMLIKEGADVNAQGGHFGNALHAASEGGYEKVVQMLIKEGADVNTQGGYFGNALQAASLRGHEKVVQMLIKKGADVNAQGGDFGNALYAASSGGHEKVVQILIKEGADINAQGGGFGNALHAASFRGHEKVVQMLIKEGADINAQGGHFGNALYAASSGGHENVVQMLIKEGADINAQGGGFGNALHAASRGGHENVVQMLIKEGADVNAQGGHFGNALYAASWGGHEKVVQMLIKEGADINAQEGHFGNALQAASEGGHENVVQMLIKEGADVNTQGGHFGNALQAASFRGHEKVVQMLIKEGADVNAQGGCSGNALQAASEGGYEKVVQLLVDKGARTLILQAQSH